MPERTEILDDTQELPEQEIPSSGPNSSHPQTTDGSVDAPELDASTGLSIPETTETSLDTGSVQETEVAPEEKVTTRIFTVANIVSIIRLCMIPIFFVLLLDGHNYMATFVFVLASATDFVDGYIARSTSTVSKLGRVLDPAVDRLLMISGVLGLYLVGRLPLWIIAVVLIRDATLLVGGFYFMTRYKVRPKVVFIGKVVTTFLFIGFGGLLLNWPILQGLGLVNASWLPGLNSEPYSWGIWFVYAGLAIGLCTTIYYVVTTLMQVGAVKAQREQERALQAEEAAVEQDTQTDQLSEDIPNQ